jgi:hypothetical protein
MAQNSGSFPGLSDGRRKKISVPGFDSGAISGARKRVNVPGLDSGDARKAPAKPMAPKRGLIQPTKAAGPSAVKRRGK